MLYHKIHIKHIPLNNNKMHKQYKFQRNHRKGASYRCSFFVFYICKILLSDKIVVYPINHHHCRCFIPQIIRNFHKQILSKQFFL